MAESVEQFKERKHHILHLLKTPIDKREARLDELLDVSVSEWSMQPFFAQVRARARWFRSRVCVRARARRRSRLTPAAFGARPSALRRKMVRHVYQQPHFDTLTWVRAWEAINKMAWDAFEQVQSGVPHHSPAA